MLRILSFILSGLLLFGCANQQAITGGPRDETPPTLISSIPKDQSTNFLGNTLILEFDEYVSVQNLKKELIITPYTEVKYSHKIRKGIFVELKLDSALEANTTYTFNFRNSVVDITEKNEATNLKLAFSTGDVIDSLSLSGKVVDLMDDKPVDGASVILYAADDTVTIDGGRPLYLIKTDKEGNYTIENLKAAVYQAMVIVEKDDNLKYNRPEEKIGFLSENFLLDSNITGLDIRVTDYDIWQKKETIL